MPVKIPNDLPAVAILANENVFVMTASRAESQDIRPLRIGILNLMPTKIATETQILRLLSNSPLQIDVDFLRMDSHVSRNTSQEHILQFYKTFKEVSQRRYDGLIVTGAPVENLSFEEVDYWDELVEIMDWAKASVTSTMYICWGAQAALYHMYGVQKYPLSEKCFGVFEHRVLEKKNSLMQGFDDRFYVPHSRHSTIRKEDILLIPELRILAESEASGVYLIASENGRSLFVTGHSEYDSDTLKNEYLRDKNKGLDIKIPQNYFLDDDPGNEIIIRWRAHSSLLYTNWLNYCVYQETPYHWE